MIEFFASYIWLAIGFMMMFFILFSSTRFMRITSFPGAMVTILVMMLGEIDYHDLYYQTDQKFVFQLKDGSGKGEVIEEPAYQDFPVTGQFTMILFILVFCLVIMNLLVGIAVSDIRQIVKTSKTDQLMAQVELACSVLNFSKTKTFEYLPTWIQNKFRR